MTENSTRSRRKAMHSHISCRFAVAQCNKAHRFGDHWSARIAGLCNARLRAEHRRNAIHTLLTQQPRPLFRT